VRSAFRIVAGAVGAFAIVSSVPFFIGSYVSEDQEIHLFHNVGGLAVYGVIIGGGLVALALSPERNVATFQGLALGSLGALAGGLLSGDVISGFWFFPALVALILCALYPDRRSLLRVGRRRVGFLALVLLAAVPIVAYALTHARLQSEGFVADPHVELHHYSGQAAGSLMLLLFAVAPGLGAVGWRLAARLAGAAVTILGAASLAYPDRASAFDPVWAWLAVAWGVTFLGLTWLGTRAQAEARA
jgi:MFS family permease